MVQTVYDGGYIRANSPLGQKLKKSSGEVYTFEALDSLSRIAEAAGHDQVLIEANGPITAVLRKYE